jgi:hypothetical protein
MNSLQQVIHLYYKRFRNRYQYHTAYSQVQGGGVYLSWTVHRNFVSDGRYSKRRCTPHLRQSRLILPS